MISLIAYAVYQNISLLKLYDNTVFTDKKID